MRSQKDHIMESNAAIVFKDISCYFLQVDIIWLCSVTNNIGKGIQGATKLFVKQKQNAQHRNCSRKIRLK